MSRILIAGCGFLGSHIGEQLCLEGHDVVGFRRNPPAIPSAIQYAKVDLTHPETLQDIQPDFDHIVVILSPDERSEQAYQAVFEVGLENLLAWLGESGQPIPLIFISSTSVYAQDQGEWVDEQSITQPSNFRGRIIAAAEQRILQLDANNTVVRFSGIYGRSTGPFSALTDADDGIQFNPPYFTNRIHWLDCVGIIKFLLGKKLGSVSLSQIYLATDSNPAPLWDVVAWMAERLQKKPPAKKTMGATAAQNKRCNNRLIRQEGYQFRYAEYKAGYNDFIYSGK
ncbi:MAG: sugar nucleotide-binding protein [Methylococcaceae bacterium]